MTREEDLGHPPAEFFDPGGVVLVEVASDHGMNFSGREDRKDRAPVRLGVPAVGLQDEYRESGMVAYPHLGYTQPAVDFHGPIGFMGGDGLDREIGGRICPQADLLLSTDPSQVRQVIRLV